MNKNTNQLILSVLLLLILVLPSGAFAYSNILSFGDSLSDNGNADNFGIQHYTNDSVWGEYLANASHLNAPLNLDMAYGGATTGYTNAAAGLPITGLNWQVDTYLANFPGQISSDTLVTVWAGANDLLFGTNDYMTATNNVEDALKKLANAGFHNFLVLNLPNIGATPYIASKNNPAVSAGATAWSQAFNYSLAQDLVDLKQIYGNSNFYSLDIYNLFNNIMSNTGAYGFNNVSDIFWVDGLHPSTQTHEIIADYANAAVTVPEPGTLILLLSGFACLVGFRRKLSHTAIN